MKEMFLASGALGLASAGPRIHSTGHLSHWTILIVLGVLAVLLISIIALSHARRNDRAATSDVSNAQVIGRFPPLTSVAAPADRDTAPVPYEAGSIVGESSQKRTKA
jgi:hypothetical protein